MKHCRIWGHESCHLPFQCCRQSRFAWTAWRWIGAFLAMLASDFAWAAYVAAVKAQTPFHAANWSVILFLLGAALVLGYTRDRTLLVPAALGAWAGTYLGVIFQ